MNALSRITRIQQTLKKRQETMDQLDVQIDYINGRIQELKEKRPKIKTLEEINELDRILDQSMKELHRLNRQKKKAQLNKAEAQDIHTLLVRTIRNETEQIRLRMMVMTKEAQDLSDMLAKEITAADSTITSMYRMDPDYDPDEILALNHEAEAIAVWCQDLTRHPMYELEARQNNGQ